MARHLEAPPPRARGRDAVVQWVLLVVCGLIALALGVLFVGFVVLAVRDSAFDRYGFPMALALGLCILFATLARDRIYRLIGKKVTPGSGGAFYG